MSESKLDIARRKGDLTTVIGAMREEARTELANAGAPAREQVDTVDGAIRLAAHFAETGTKKGAERRDAMRGVRPGASVSNKGVVAKTQLSQAERLVKTLTWSRSLTQDQRDAFIVSEKFETLTDLQQERISEAFSQVEDRAYEDSIGIANFDFDAETPDVDSIIGDEDDGEAEADDLGDSDFEAMFEQAAWEAEAT